MIQNSSQIGYLWDYNQSKVYSISVVQLALLSNYLSSFAVWADYLKILIILSTRCQYWADSKSLHHWSLQNRRSEAQQWRHSDRTDVPRRFDNTKYLCASFSSLLLLQLPIKRSFSIINCQINDILQLYLYHSNSTFFF